MQRDFATRFTGGAFLAAAVMLWGGWMLLPHEIGTFFEATDFAAVNASFQLWIWTYRVHLFGLIATVAALAALAALLAANPARVLVWPGAAVAASGFLVGALAAAFYYHHGAWGALALAGRPQAEAAAMVEAIRLDTEYVTCLVRFARVFSGLGLVVLAAGILRGRVLPSWVGGAALVLGLAAMAVTMGFPDDLGYFAPIFHLECLWLAATGAVILARGIAVGEPPRPTAGFTA